MNQLNFLAAITKWGTAAATTGLNFRKMLLSVITHLIFCRKTTRKSRLLICRLKLWVRKFKIFNNCGRIRKLVKGTGLEGEGKATLNFSGHCKGLLIW